MHSHLGPLVFSLFKPLDVCCTKAPVFKTVKWDSQSSIIWSIATLPSGKWSIIFSVLTLNQFTQPACSTRRHWLTENCDFPACFNSPYFTFQLWSSGFWPRGSSVIMRQTLVSFFTFVCDKSHNIYQRRQQKETLLPSDCSGLPF